MDTEPIIVEETTTITTTVIDTPSERVSRRGRTRQSTGPYSVDRNERLRFRRQSDDAVAEETQPVVEESKGIVGNVKGFFTNWWNLKAYSSEPQEAPVTEAEADPIADAIRASNGITNVQLNYYTLLLREKVLPSEENNNNNGVTPRRARSRSRGRRASIDDSEDVVDDNLTLIRIRLPDGTRLKNKFPKNDKVQVLRDFLDEKLKKSDYSLSVRATKDPVSNFDISFSEAGLHPIALLNLESL